MSKKHYEMPCEKSKTGLCPYARNKRYGYGFLSGTATECTKEGKFVSDLKKCPLIEDKC